MHAHAALLKALVLRGKIHIACGAAAGRPGRGTSLVSTNEKAVGLWMQDVRSWQSKQDTGQPAQHKAHVTQAVLLAVSVF